MNRGLSIIVPMYNAEKTILLLLESLNLEFKGIQYEIILIDDFSNDETSVVVQNLLCDKIKLLKNEKNLGTSGSRNIGIRNSKYDYLCFFDADDYIIGNLFKELVNIEYFKYDILYFDIKIDTKNQMEFKFNDKRNILKSGGVCNKIYSRKVISEFNHNLTFEDVDFLYNLGYFNKFIKIENVQYNIKREYNETSKMANFNRDDYMLMYNNIEKKYDSFENYKKMFFQESFMYVVLTNCKLGLYNRLKILINVLKKIIKSKFIIFFNLYSLKK